MDALVIDGNIVRTADTTTSKNFNSRKADSSRLGREQHLFRLGTAERCWKELHHARVCIQADKWLNVARLPPAENHAICLNYHARGPGTEVI
jgi:hypothetical protein